MELNDHLALRSYIIGHSLTSIDLIVYGTIRGNRSATPAVPSWPNVHRWFLNIEATCPWMQAARDALNAAINHFKTAEEGVASIASIASRSLHGPIVTRFPPEPSGYLHIGHAKAALLNAMIAQEQGGTLICRFDDTNPSKESQEYQDSILVDLAAIGVIPDRITYSSDYFEQMFHACVDMIRAGKAYADNTDPILMKAQRGDGIVSQCRETPIEDSLSKLEAMKAGTPDGQEWCIRAKISIDNPNKALRDPVIYRCNLTEHHRTGSTWKLYPTYDFCAPFVDAIEGVSLALRTTEYNDRNAQYVWIQEAMQKSNVPMWEFSRLSFVRTVLSKRKLARIEASGMVRGWDDPRMPTIRGIMRRGLTVTALQEFIRAQGPSRNIVALDWSLLWALNKKHIDPVAPRFTAVRMDGVVMATVDGIFEVKVLEKPKHPKNKDFGSKTVAYSNDIILDQPDARLLVQDEETTLMNWGNAFVRTVLRDKDSGQVISVDLQLHLAGDVKATKKKITWLSRAQNLCAVKLHEFGHLITKDKLQKTDNVLDFVNKDSEKVEDAWTDSNVAELNGSDIIQLERYGYYRVDEPAAAGRPAVLFKIPSGKE